MGVQGGNGPVLSLVSCCFNSRLSELVPRHRAVTLWTARTLVTVWGPVTLRSSWHTGHRGRWHSLGTCQGWRGGYSCTLFHSSLSSWLSPKPDPRKKPIHFLLRQTMQVNAGRCFLFLETPSGAFSFKSFSLSMRKLLLEVATIHSMSHFNKKPNPAFLERGRKHKVGVFGLEPVEQLGCAQGWPPASLFLLQDHGSSEASAETGNQQAGKSAGCVWIKPSPNTAQATTQPTTAEL